VTEPTADLDPVSPTDKASEAPHPGEDLAIRLAALETEVAQAREQVLRAQAEMANIRRRAEQDVEKAHKFALERFAGELLSVVDNLERALAAIPPEEGAQREGVELTLKSLLGTLEKYGVSLINPHGEHFNPEYHQAIAMLDAPHAAPNSVVDVMQKGYSLNGRLLRPAMVAVAKPG
jgi:molecular chaperone GrpE